MFSIGDVKFIALIHYDIYMMNNTYSHEKMVELINHIIDTFQLLENIKNKESELMKMIDDD